MEHQRNADLCATHEEDLPLGEASNSCDYISQLEVRLQASIEHINFCCSLEAKQSLKTLTTGCWIGGLALQRVWLCIDICSLSAKLSEKDPMILVIVALKNVRRAT
eukprot:4373268-Amphidinium_carterae.2